MINVTVKMSIQVNIELESQAEFANIKAIATALKTGNVQVPTEAGPAAYALGEAILTQIPK